MNLMDKMDFVGISTLAKRLSLIAGKKMDNQQAYYIINCLLGLKKVNKGCYDWAEYMSLEDSGKVKRAVNEYLNDTSFKIKPSKFTPIGLQRPEPKEKDETDMEYVSNQLLKNDEVWFEARKRIGRIIREELMRLC